MLAMWPNLNTKLASIVTRSGVDSKQTNNHTSLPLSAQRGDGEQHGAEKSLSELTESMYNLKPL